jgi:uncharacterized membrane protein
LWDRHSSSCSPLINGFTSGIDAALTGSAQEPSIIGTVINLALGTLLSMGATAFYLAAHDNPATADLSLLWHPRPFWKYLGASILLALAVAIGFVLLIVPGIILGLMFMFTTFVVIERELGPIDAMSEVIASPRGHKWLFGFVLLLLLINVLGVLALVVGLLVSIPVPLRLRACLSRVGRQARDASSRCSACCLAQGPDPEILTLGGAGYSAGTSGRSALAASAALRGLR